MATTYNYGEDDARVEIITAATTLTASDSGKTFTLSAAAGANITLPGVARGLNYRFTVGLSFITTAWTVTAATAVIQGNVVVAGAHVAGANESLVTFAHAAESVGDYVYIWSDGTNWYIEGSAVTTAGITLTAP